MNLRLDPHAGDPRERAGTKVPMVPVAPGGTTAGSSGAESGDAPDAAAGVARSGSFPPVQSVVRAVRLLQALNRQPKSSIDILHRQTGIPKPSLVRLLQTLARVGLVSHGPQHGAYYVTSQVRTLASGYHGEPKVVEAAGPVLEAMTRRIKWPMALAVYEDHAVAVRYSTIPNSPLALLHSTINLRHSLISRALGRAWLAFCDAGQQAVILDGLQSSKHAEDAAARDPLAMRELFAAVRAQGYATRDPSVRPVSNTIAVPVFDGDRVIASIGLTYFSSTLTTEQAVERYLPELRSAAGQISDALASIDDPSTDARATLPSIIHPAKETPWPLTPN